MKLDPIKIRIAMDLFCEIQIESLAELLLIVGEKEGSDYGTKEEIIKQIRGIIAENDIIHKLSFALARQAAKETELPDILDDQIIH